MKLLKATLAGLTIAVIGASVLTGCGKKEDPAAAKATEDETAKMNASSPEMKGQVPAGGK